MTISSSRRRFLKQAGLAMLVPFSGGSHTSSSAGANSVTLFLCGDVMIGRGIDQVLPYPVDPRLYEPYVKSAIDYVRLAEDANGSISAPVCFDYPWGDALDVWREMAPDARIVNLETAVTNSDDHWEGKSIHYRMDPRNVLCLSAANLDCCVLANNHVLDWGYAGLEQTLSVLHDAGLKTAGVGRNRDQAAAPAVLEAPGKSRIWVFAFGSETSGIPWTWAAQRQRSGVNLLPDLSEKTVERIAGQVRAVKQPGDLVVASIHWGGNWGYQIPDRQRGFAQALIDHAGADVVHGHSSHHPKGIEVYRDRPILYGCGDFLNDYEGIRGYEQFRDDLSLMYFPRFDPASGRLQRFEMAPMQIRRFRLQRASEADARWLSGVLDRESRKLGCRVELGEDGMLALSWGGQRGAST